MCVRERSKRRMVMCAQKKHYRICLPVAKKIFNLYAVWRQYKKAAGVLTGGGGGVPKANGAGFRIL